MPVWSDSQITDNVTLHQAVSAAQRELSGCEERSEEAGDTDQGDIGEDEAARWPLGYHGVTMTVMGITATDCFLFNLSLCELYKFWLLASVARESEWALARKLALPLSKGRAAKQEKHFQAARARVKVNVRKKDTTLENMPIVCIGTRIPGNDKCHDSESSSWKWIKA